ncbi:flagellar brake protein [Robbsia andropogonis]|uniref:flagellar brake protein n=1 Tax=Robbsia andropogonis TaxID=28092 RepID=UPI00046379CC|nr:flagellar brake protein [Robbsia andropogonis]
MATALAIAAADLHAPVSTPIVDADYWHRHPLQIAMCLRNLMSHHDRMTVTFDGGGQYTLRVLDVDSREGRFTFDASNVDADNIALLASDALSFSSLPGTIETRFTTNGAIKVHFDERPAFEVSFPSALFFAQRREHFRVQVPATEPFNVVGVAPDGVCFQRELYDISLGGIALKTPERLHGKFVLGSMLHDVTLELGHFGSVAVNLEVMSPRCMTTAKGEALYIAGCRFVDKPGSAERLLQRVVMHLETHRQSMARRL